MERIFASCRSSGTFFVSVSSNTGVVMFLFLCSCMLIKFSSSLVCMHVDAALSGIEYVHLMRELSELEGGRINKVYQDDSLFLFSVFTGSSRTNLLVELGRVMYFTDEKPSFPKTPGGFCMFLRKRLQGGRVNRFFQRGSERVLEMHVSTKNASYILVFEMFGKGNLLVCDEAYKIISAFDSVSFADRSLRGGQVYVAPDPQPDVTCLSEEEFSSFFGSEQAVKVLASTVGLGGEFAELVCSRAGVDKTLKKPDTSLLYASLKDLLLDSSAQYSVDRAYPVRVLEDAQDADSFCSALSSLLDPLREKQEREEVLESREKVTNKYERIISAQQKQIKGLSASIAVNQRKGELLYEYYQDLDSLLSQARKDRKELSEEAFIQKYESHPLVVSVTGLELVVEVGEDE